MEVRYKPIGVVVRGLQREGMNPSRYSYVAEIRVLDDYLEGLEGLGSYSHVIVVFHMHEVRGYKLRVVPWGRSDIAPQVGVFATRSPMRPNPIGVSACLLEEVNPPILKVRGLDAYEGTPVLDIKPYDYYDIVRNPRVPEWFKRYWAERKKGYDDVAPWLGPC